jgi:HK97 family phage prohead protease
MGEHTYSRGQTQKRRSAIVRKLLPVEIKSVSERVLEFVGSTEAQDRDGEVIEAAGWDLKAFRKNPVFLWAHSYHQPPIGRAVKVAKADGQLVFQIEFADRETYEFADTIYRLYKGGFLHATSVGFIPKEAKDGEGEGEPRRIFKKQELLELSAVPVPSNPEALISARDAGLISVKEFDGLTTQNVDFLEEVVPLLDYQKDDPLLKRDMSIEAMEAALLEPGGADDDGSKEVMTGDNYEQPTIDLADMIPTAKEVSQQEMADEIDYVQGLVLQWDFNDDNTASLKELASAIIERLSGSDIPVDILEKAGAVLSAKNKQNLKQAQVLIQIVLDSAEPQQEEADEPNDDDEVAQVVSSAIRELGGKYQIRRR